MKVCLFTHVLSVTDLHSMKNTYLVKIRGNKDIQRGKKIDQGLLGKN